jgi:hypothetical protein
LDLSSDANFRRLALHPHDRGAVKRRPDVEAMQPASLSVEEHAAARAIEA